MAAGESRLAFHEAAVAKEAAVGGAFGSRTIKERLDAFHIGADQDAGQGNAEIGEILGTKEETDRNEVGEEERQ